MHKTKRMKKTHIKKMIDELYAAIATNFDPELYEVVAVDLRTYINSQGEEFIHSEAIIACKDEKGQDYRINKDFDLPEHKAKTKKTTR